MIGNVGACPVAAFIKDCYLLQPDGPHGVLAYYEDGTPVEVCSINEGIRVSQYFDKYRILESNHETVYYVPINKRAYPTWFPKIYIAGPIHNNPNYKKQFDDRERLLKNLGYFPINPTNIVPIEWPRDMAMRLINPMLDMADGIILLDGWAKSPGTHVEIVQAEYIGKRIFNNMGELLSIRWATNTDGH